MPFLGSAVALALALPAAARALPHHHPQHHAPPELLQRISHSNPTSLLPHGEHGAAAPAPLLQHPAAPLAAPPRRPFAAGLRVTPSSMGADPTGREDSWAALDAALRHCLNQSAGASPQPARPSRAAAQDFDDESARV